MPIFPPEELDTYAFQFEPRADRLNDIMTRLGALRARRTSGELRALTETNVEQSFNERLFGELFGYRTVFRDGLGHYHLRPKSYLAGSRRLYTDFSLGFYSAESGRTIATAELKAPGADLDAAQAGSYRGKSAVDQAIEQATAADCAWAIVSNFEELRLYRASDPARFERFTFDDVSPQRLRRALALFSRPSLLGTGEAPAPLERNLSTGLRHREASV